MGEVVCAGLESSIQIIGGDETALMVLGGKIRWPGLKVALSPVRDDVRTQYEMARSTDSVTEKKMNP